MEAVLAEARGDLQLVLSDLLVAVAAVLHRLRPELGQALLGSGLAPRRLVLRAGRRDRAVGAGVPDVDAFAAHTLGEVQTPLGRSLGGLVVAVVAGQLRALG
ncbi:hypothetical protein, partial [Microbacterium lacticum]|uniref:hypothetical protein n=1 Tax=Microbacterium lacticum TaxID=33885 RepID=UPI001C3FF228